MRYLFVILFVSSVSLGGCGSKWTDSDTKSASDAVKGEHLIEQMCGGDGGDCKASQVRSIERMDTCALESMLHNHGQPLAIDGGPKCQ